MFNKLIDVEVNIKKHITIETSKCLNQKHPIEMSCTFQLHLSSKNVHRAKSTFYLTGNMNQYNTHVIVVSTLKQNTEIV